MKHLQTFESFLNESGNEVIFSIDDDKLDQLLNSRFSRQLDYKDDKGDSLYVLPKREFDRFIDLADSSGFDVDYENSEDSVIYVQESVVNEVSKPGSMTITEFEKAWTKAYGETLKDDYYDVWKKLSGMKSFTLSDVEDVWEESYGESFRFQYSGLYKQLNK